MFFSKSASILRPGSVARVLGQLGSARLGLALGLARQSSARRCPAIDCRCCKSVSKNQWLPTTSFVRPQNWITPQPSWKRHVMTIHKYVSSLIYRISDCFEKVRFISEIYHSISKLWMSNLYNFSVFRTPYCLGNTKRRNSNLPLSTYCRSIKALINQGAALFD